VSGLSSIAEGSSTPAVSAGKAGGGKRLAIFTSHPIQYQAPFFRALAASGRLSPTVYFGSRHGADVALDSGFGKAFRWDAKNWEP